ncbi:MAG: hypothetical protein IKI33_06170, partial [Eubacterium sp.]|nr:hypothetical protein [Eubacterium sp.]
LLTESGAGLGKSASYVDADGVRTWTVKTSIGTKGNRVITVKAKGADGQIVDEGAKTAEIVVTK